MKNKFDFFGIKSPKRKELIRLFINKNGLPLKENADDVILGIWNFPQRECQYAALDILERCMKKNLIQNIQLYEKLIISKSWWDTVDRLATRIVGTHFNHNPDDIFATHKIWMDSGNIWLQRVCILFQLKYKSMTDKDLLLSTIDQLKESNEFFIQKAIGWALREYSKTDARIVKQFISSHELVPLSAREGMKFIKSGKTMRSEL